MKRAAAAALLGALAAVVVPAAAVKPAPSGAVLNNATLSRVIGFRVKEDLPLRGSKTDFGSASCGLTARQGRRGSILKKGYFAVTSAPREIRLNLRGSRRHTVSFYASDSNASVSIECQVEGGRPLTMPRLRELFAGTSIELDAD